MSDGKANIVNYCVKALRHLNALMFTWLVWLYA
jgi:hypothetical protein